MYEQSPNVGSAPRMDEKEFAMESSIFPLDEVGSPLQDIYVDQRPRMWATPSLSGFPGFAPFPYFPNDGAPDWRLYSPDEFELL